MKKTGFWIGALVVALIVMTEAFAPRNIDSTPLRAVDTGSYMLGLEDSAGVWTNAQKFKIGGIVEYNWSTKDSTALADTAGVLRALSGSGSSSHDVMVVNVNGATAAQTIGTYTTTCQCNYLISDQLNVNSISTDVLQYKVSWTDIHNTLQTYTFINASATGWEAPGAVSIYTKSGSVITFSTVMATGGGSINYDASAVVTLQHL